MRLFEDFERVFEASLPDSGITRLVSLFSNPTQQYYREKMSALEGAWENYGGRTKPGKADTVPSLKRTIQFVCGGVRSRWFAGIKDDAKNALWGVIEDMGQDDPSLTRRMKAMSSYAPARVSLTDKNPPMTPGIAKMWEEAMPGILIELGRLYDRRDAIQAGEQMIMAQERFDDRMGDILEEFEQMLEQQPDRPGKSTSKSLWGGKLPSDVISVKLAEPDPERDREKEKSVGEQNRHVEQIVNQVLEKLPRAVRHPIRMAVQAADKNEKLQVLQREIVKRNLKI
jgi:hypothetical protein